MRMSFRSLKGFLRQLPATFGSLLKTSTMRQRMILISIGIILIAGITMAAIMSYQEVKPAPPGGEESRHDDSGTESNSMRHNVQNAPKPELVASEKTRVDRMHEKNLAKDQAASHLERIVTLPCGCIAPITSQSLQGKPAAPRGPESPFPLEAGAWHTQLAEPIILVIDTQERTLTMYSQGRPIKQYPVAVGKPATPSPPGEWRITRKASWSGGFGTRWMGLNVPWGIYGIHGTNKPWSIGDAASGGCIRMHNQHVEELFNLVKPGTLVKIVSHPYDPLRNPRRLLGPGERGADVLLAERRLAHLGYSVGKIDGLYDDDTVKAVKEFQRKRGLRVTGEITDEVYDALGMYLVD